MMTTLQPRKKLRLPEYDYSWPGWYYVTVCTRDREPLFGQIVDDHMVLNHIGRIVEEEWLKTPLIRKNVALDDYVIMPNHLHGIVIINDAIVGATRRVAPTEGHPKLRSASLGAILGQFKSIATKRARKECLLSDRSLWQRGYYDHVIRNDADLHRIREYIATNPRRWALDKENPVNTQKEASPSRVLAQ